MLTFIVYILSPFPFQSFSPIPITPFQALPVFRSNAGPDSLNLRQVYQPVPQEYQFCTCTLFISLFLFYLFLSLCLSLSLTPHRLLFLKRCQHFPSVSEHFSPSSISQHRERPNYTRRWGRS